MAHYVLGFILADTGKVDEAIAHLELAVRLQPNFADAHNKLGDALKQKGQLAQANEHYQAAGQATTGGPPPAPPATP
jgi:Flp pilus assembly protein TadD